MRWEEEKEEEDEDTGPGQRPGTKEDSHTTSHAHTNTEHDFPARGIHKGLTPPTSDIHTHIYIYIYAGRRNDATWAPARLRLHGARTHFVPSVA